MRQLHFLLLNRLDGYVFNPIRKDGLTFNAPNDSFRITIHSKNEPGSFGEGYDSLEMRVTTSCEATDAQIEFVEALIAKTYLSHLGVLKKLPLLDGERVLIDANGKITKGYSPTWDMLPDDLRELGQQVDTFLREVSERFMQLLRWQQKADGPVAIFEERARSPVIYWKTTQDQYHLAPLPKQEPIVIIGDPSGGLKWDEGYEKDFKHLWSDEGAREPLGHQLLREALEVRHQNSRSALLIAYSALEVGLKQHISECAPDAAWLAMFSPSPPLLKMLRDYLPQLHSDKPSFTNWKDAKKLLNKVNGFTEDRNRLAHRGETIVGSLDEYLTITSDLLYAFDVFEGREWAKSKVSRSFRATMKW